ncbi:helix-turn-helix transcriptional regulator [Roseicella sp. DB1501]|uniref:helix-turn-helix domain-containing protein n=1 Tax=Roseicella sp. DB1501 TaxID=2730925 RepID=UPI001490D823|nr:helix-turn-helix transcriptional regulator [Roseicella sp. DB1501]
MPKRREGRAGSLYEAVGAELRAHRAACGLRQEELALRVGISRASVANIEGGRQTISLHHLTDLAEALETTASSLLRAVEAHQNKQASIPADLPPAVQTFLKTKIRLVP